MNKIKYIFIDIDGVLTDGTVQIDASGNESKRICYHDLDAIGKGRRNGFDFAFITGEDTDMARFITKRFNVSVGRFGAKDKLKAIQNLMEELNVTREEICYIGDSERDIPAIELAKIGAAPADALDEVKKVADVVLNHKGGEGVLMELVSYLIAEKNK